MDISMFFKVIQTSIKSILSYLILYMYVCKETYINYFKSQNKNDPSDVPCLFKALRESQRNSGIGHAADFNRESRCISPAREHLRAARDRRRTRRSSLGSRVRAPLPSSIDTNHRHTGIGRCAYKDAYDDRVRIASVT